MPCAQSRHEAARSWDPVSTEDLYFMVKGEVQKAVHTAQGLFDKWTELFQHPFTARRQEISWIAIKLRNNLSSMEWDREDLEIISMTCPTTQQLHCWDLPQRYRCNETPGHLHPDVSSSNVHNSQTVEGASVSIER
uniref:Syntaxin 6/10/61 N-terminal domain-containing protein n=1 Tax=Canis lupus dingo TaxID=286419 RepID=A0A8C0LPI2_CANLU